MCYIKRMYIHRNVIYKKHDRSIFCIHITNKILHHKDKIKKSYTLTI